MDTCKRVFNNIGTFIFFFALSKAFYFVFWILLTAAFPLLYIEDTATLLGMMLSAVAVSCFIYVRRKRDTVKQHEYSTCVCDTYPGLKSELSCFLKSREWKTDVITATSCSFFSAVLKAALILIEELPKAYNAALTTQTLFSAVITAVLSWIIIDAVYLALDVLILLLVHRKWSNRFGVRI